MSGAAEGSGSTTKAVTEDTKPGETLKDQQKPAAALEEDDEFEDFPVEGSKIVREFLHLLIRAGDSDSLSLKADVWVSVDWSQEDAEAPGGTNTHLWEESWDDDDTSEDFSAQLKEELKKVDASKRG
ncbi:MAG: hypothetical protein M1827_006480 [Pycnora praestabilis]|nr:MAG: hypothetical protein M1827_006480 [Pycnora praestabilis]